MTKEAVISKSELLNILWVEGEDDYHICKHLLRHYNLVETNMKTPTNDLLWPLAERVVEDVIKVDCRFPLVHKSKALIHTWLAWQEEIRTPLGWAITKHYFDANAPQAQHLINWMRHLFDIQPIK